MIAILALFVLLCLYGIKISWKKEALVDYMSVPHTQSIKGIFILLVFFSHFNSYVNLTAPTDVLYRNLIRLFGQTMVTLFLFYSGYGVMESIRAKGSKYVASLPVNRILATLFKFDCAVLLFVLLAVILGDHITWGQLVLSLIGWESVGNSNWYIFVILLLYAFTYAAFALFGKQKPVVPVAVVTGLSVIYIIVISAWNIRPYHWYDTVLCYALGMFYSLYRKPFEKIVNRNRLTYLCALAVTGGLFLVSMKWSSLPGMGYLIHLAFTMTVVIATMRITLHNRVLQFCGKNLFELYILQRIPMIIFSRMGWASNPVAYFAVCMIATLLIVMPFKLISDKAWKQLTVKKKQPV